MLPALVVFDSLPAAISLYEFVCLFCEKSAVLSPHYLLGSLSLLLSNVALVYKFYRTK